jgi:hypothetical protein
MHLAKTSSFKYLIALTILPGLALSSAEAGHSSPHFNRSGGNYSGGNHNVAHGAYHNGYHGAYYHSNHGAYFHGHHGEYYHGARYYRGGYYQGHYYEPGYYPLESEFFDAPILPFPLPFPFPVPGDG